MTRRFIDMHTHSPQNTVLLTIHVDLLAQFYELHLCWHVAHSPHAVPQVFTADEPVFVLVKLPECLTQLCAKRRQGVNVRVMLKDNFRTLFSHVFFSKRQPETNLF